MSRTPEPRAAELRHEAESVLRPLADLAAPVAPGSTPPWDQLVRIREWEVTRAAGCAASLAYDDFDGWRAAFARRQLGLAVLERLRKGATADPATIARDVIDGEIRTSQSSLASWLATLGTGGTAAVVREVTTYAIATRLAFTAWPPIEGTRFDDRFAWDLPGRAVRLEATADAVTRPTRDLLVLATSEPQDDAAEQRALAWPALVATLQTGQLPARVTRIDLASGDRRTVPITDDVLDTALTAAAGAVDAAIAVRYASPPEPVGGWWCGRCPVRVTCPASHYAASK